MPIIRHGCALGETWPNPYCVQMAVRHSAPAGKERELEDLFDLSLDLLCIASVDGYFKRVNLAFEPTLGYTRAELLSRPFYEFIHADDRERTREAMAVLARGEELLRFENRYIRSDGAERWLQWNTRPLPSKGLVCAAGRDVTDSRRREAEAALRRVAILVAHSTPPSDVFTAVAAEIRQLLDADAASVSRYESPAAVTRFADVVHEKEIPAGSRLPLDGENLAALVQRTGQPARMDYQGASGPIAALMHEQGIRWAVGVPILVEDRVWGTVAAGWRREQPAFSDSEQRIAQFTELVAAAIATADSRAALQQLADEQAALRRVATLVARGAPPEEVFSAVAAEVSRTLDADLTRVFQFEPDGTGTVIASAGATNVPAGSRWKLEPPLAVWIVASTGLSGRVDDYGAASVDLAMAKHGERLKSGVSSPIIVDGRVWGAISAGSLTGPLAADTEARLASFTELLGTAIANAQSRTELTASRARIVAAGDETRRRIERDLHDGAQQRLVSLALELRAAQAALPPGLDPIEHELSRVATGLVDAQHELQEISRGIHPAILSDGGVGPAVKALARRSPVPVDLDLRVPGRLPKQIEVAAYYVVSEMLANTAKHASATAVHISVATLDGVLLVSVRDDGIGGADAAGGSGLIGIRDRVEALGGTLSLQSPPGAGTSITVELPLAAYI